MSFLLFFTILHYITTTAGIALNLLLMYLVYTKTPRYIRTYSIVLFNFALTELLVCTSDAFTQVRVAPCGFSVAYLFVGTCKLLGSYPCYLGYSVMMHLYAHSLYSLVVSFWYRWTVIHKPCPSPKVMALVLLCMYMPSLFQMATFNFAAASEEEARTILTKYNYTLTDFAVSANAYIFEWKTAFAMFHMTLPVTPCYAAILYFRSRTIQRLNEHPSMSCKTKNMHAELLQAITCQACLPGLYSIGVVCYALGQSGIYHHAALEYLTFMSFVFLPVLSPMCSLYFVKPYRIFLQSKGKMKMRVYSLETGWSKAT